MMTASPTLSLDKLPYRRTATVAAVDWSGLSEPEQRRLRNMGLDEGVEVEALHGGPFGRDPIAVRIGRITLAMRRTHARAIQVNLGRGVSESAASA
jgi:ferrous iron transport protein A